jgi:hypothetical protein
MIKDEKGSLEPEQLHRKKLMSSINNKIIQRAQNV